MKKVKLVLITVIVFVITSSLQAQTTLEEYNYVTKGYKVQFESGLDMKKGYEFENVESQTTNERTAKLKVLYRTKSGKKEIAAYMIEYNKTGNAKQYICIPHPNSEEEILQKFWYMLYDGGNSNQNNRLQLFAYLMSRTMKW